MNEQYQVLWMQTCIIFENNLFKVNFDGPYWGRTGLEVFNLFVFDGRRENMQSSERFDDPDLVKNFTRGHVSEMIVLDLMFFIFLHCRSVWRI